MIFLLACSTPSSPPPAQEQTRVEAPAPLAPPVVHPPTISALPAFTPTADALSDAISTIEPGAAPTVLIQRRALTTGCAVSLLMLPTLESKLLATLPFCPEQFLVGGPQIVALTPGHAPAAWLLPVDGSPKLPLPDASNGATCFDAKGSVIADSLCAYPPVLLRSDSSTMAAHRVTDPTELADLNSAAASNSGDWQIAEGGAPDIAWAQLQEASGPVASGPAMVKGASGWALVASTSTIKPLRVDRSGSWLYIGSDRESQIFDLRTHRLVWRDPSRVWFWPASAGPEPEPRR